MHHDWAKTEDGSVDLWRYDEGNHNGPFCLRCEQSFCIHCEKDYLYTQRCPSAQLKLNMNGA